MTCHTFAKRMVAPIGRNMGGVLELFFAFHCCNTMIDGLVRLDHPTWLAALN